MIQIISKETLYTYNLFHICKAFFPNEEIGQKVEPEAEKLIYITGEGLNIEIDEDAYVETEERQERKMLVSKYVYDRLCKETGKSLSWGMLTGVRPTKLVMKEIEKGKSLEEAVAVLETRYGVSEEKALLAAEIAEREKKLLCNLDYKDGFSLYVGIPFCPSICSYCSFSSSPIGLWKETVDDYLDALCQEIRAFGEIARGKKLNTIYIGGGTPTTLEAEQLEKLLTVIDQTFAQDALLEYTVEAGRPDSITKEKLAVIKKHPVTRISVNPQTMQQKTLDAVGRKHSVEDVKKIFYIAREMGFDNINMDLIAGLPGEDSNDMKDTLSQIEDLHPDSLTVHALAIKRAARMNQEDVKVDLGEEISQMVELSAESASKMELKPYYLYRQKNIAGNFENVGYAKVDKAGIYNILIMEEKQTILAAGAGATTKIVLPEKIRQENGKETNLIRIENVKDIHEYINRIDEMIERKGEKLWH